MYIKREDAIKALRCEYPAMPMFKGLREKWAIKTEGFRKAEEVIRSIPSADRPQGEWEIYVISPFDGEDCRCSECGQTGCVPYWDYCPNCGARMRGINNE